VTRIIRRPEKSLLWREN